MKMAIINKSKHTGFTLIEMIVTVSIAAILASIAIPSFTTMIKNNRLTASTNELVSALILARSEALKRSQNVSVCASTNQTSCSGTNFATGWIVFVDCSSPPNGVLDATVDCNGDGDTTDADDKDTIVKVHGPIAGMSISKTGNTGYQAYNFAGRSAVSTFTVTPTSGSGSKQISISLTGRLQTN